MLNEDYKNEDRLLLYIHNNETCNCAANSLQLTRTGRKVRVLDYLDIAVLDLYLLSIITMYSTIILHVLRVEAICDKSVMLDQHKQNTNSVN